MYIKQLKQLEKKQLVIKQLEKRPQQILANYLHIIWRALPLLELPIEAFRIF